MCYVFLYVPFCVYVYVDRPALRQVITICVDPTLCVCVCMCVCIYAYMQWHIMVSYASALLKSTERLMTSFLKSHIYGQTWENSEIWILKGLGGPVITVQMHHCMCLSNDFIHIVQHLSAFYHSSRFNEEFSQCDFIRFLQFCLL